MKVTLELGDAFVLVELPCPAALEVEELLCTAFVVGLDDPPALELVVLTAYDVLPNVVICAADTVTFIMATPPTVFTQRQKGSSVGTKSPVVLGPRATLGYVTR